ncbi:hypothetical protein DMUE_4313 [Dictyocoela muelleri]|nr:hypothetical protein DMUE_4313 [Dictyocoela muelleri]
MNNDLDMNPFETFISSLKRFKIIDSLKLILESWSEISSETINKCYKKAIENAYIEIKPTDLVPELEDYETPCFAVFEDEKCFLDETKKSLRIKISLMILIMNA